MQSAVASARTETAQPDITPVQKMCSAVSGALLTSLLVTPLDVVKFRLQSQSAAQSATSRQAVGLHEQTITACCREVFFKLEKSSASCTQACANGASHVARAAADVSRLRFSGTLDAVVKIVRHEGLTSLWHGLSPTLVMSVPATVIYFVGYDSIRDWLHKRHQLNTTVSALLSGAVARTVAVTFISPMELVRTRMQSMSGENKRLRGVLDGVRRMVAKHGVLSLWKGLGPTLWRDVPFSAIYWVGYESMKHHLLSNFACPDVSDQSFMHLESANVQHPVLTEFQIASLSGAASGMFAATVTTPFDVAKTRKQIDMKELLAHAADRAADAEKVTGRSSVAVMREIINSEGYRGLFRGLTARVFKVAPACAIMISSYERGKSFFGSRIHRRYETTVNLQRSASTIV